MLKSKIVQIVIIVSVLLVFGSSFTNSATFEFDCDDVSVYWPGTCYGPYTKWGNVISRGETNCTAQIRYICPTGGVCMDLLLCPW